MFLTGMFCYITWHFYTERENLGYERKYSFKKKNFSSIVSCDRTDPSIYHNADTGSRENALPDAHTGVYYVDISADGHMVYLLGLLHLF